MLSIALRCNCNMILRYFLIAFFQNRKDKVIEKMLLK